MFPTPPCGIFWNPLLQIQDSPSWSPENSFWTLHASAKQSLADAWTAPSIEALVHRKTSSAFLTSIEESKFGTEISSSSETDSSTSWFGITLEFMMSVAISESDFSPDVCKLSSIDTYRKKVSSIPSSSLMIISSVKLKPHKFSASSAMFSPHFLKQFDIVLDETMSHALRIVCMESKIESDFESLFAVEES
ncbi:hypothetical protein AVEN_78179-1 [Araneus ventricosus]|uniref:Uncharacterized protein n=1 Tax=Araneus ventricosus TaxID=182803 RepID=A0A4Y2N7T0_ARAVE|nr:hypothetical protein AVEN_78179-1 [Araneus ventricosus]